ncbi:MAG: sulfite exporter TauE/SafE family protein [Bacteroidia bacterium]
MFNINSNFIKVVMFHKGISKRIVVYLGTASVLAVFLGALLSTRVEAKSLEIFLGVFLIALSAVFLIKQHVVLKPNKTGLIWGGLSSGFAAGLLGTGGAIRGLALSSFALGKDAFVSTSALIDLGVDLSRTGVYFFEGYFKTVELSIILWLALVSAVGSYIGKRILNRISEDQFRKVVLWLILFVGIATVFTGIFK